MSTKTITFVGEGITDIAVARRLCLHSGIAVDFEYDCSGKGNLDARLPGFNNAARHHPWFILRDLDYDADCAPSLVALLLTKPSRHMILRIAVRSVESWLLADSMGIAQFLSVPPRAVPSNPELLDDPKRSIVDLARMSRRSIVRKEMVPGPNSGRKVGPGYMSSILSFIHEHWDIGNAVATSVSLSRCIEALRRS